MSLQSRSWVGVSATLVLLLSCGKDVAEPSGSEGHPLALAVIVSNVIDPSPATVRAGIGQAAVMAPPGPAVYVSLLPGTVPHGATLTMQNLTGGAAVTTPIVDGGADPVAVAGNEGDSLRVTATDSVGGTFADVEVMRVRARPRVVRTVPAAHKTDVPLNSRIQVVFSEPVSLPSAEQGVRLRRGASSVAGTLRVVPGSPTALELVLEEPLEPSKDYILEIDATVADRDGDVLAATVSVPFTTGTSQVTRPAARLAFNDIPPQLPDVLAGLPLWYSYQIVVLDSTDQPISDYGQPVEIRIGVNPVGGTLSGTTTAAPSDWNYGSFDFKDLRIDRPGSGYTLVATSPGLPSITSAPFDVVPATDLIALEGYAPTIGALAIWLVSASGHGVSIIHAVGMDLAWSPDATRIAYASPHFAEASDLYVVTADGRAITRLTSGMLAHSPTWSPDGSRIAFASERDGGSDLFVMSADGSGMTPLTSDGVSTSPAWSPDGRKVAFVSGAATEGGGGAIFVMNADGSGAVQLTTGLTAGYPAWSPDGTRIAFSIHQRASWTLAVMHADGSGITPLTFEAPSVNDIHPSWSPDGGRLVFQRSFVLNGDGASDVYLVNSDGSGETVLVPNNGMYCCKVSPSWSP